ncbi:hypothetical protein R0I52_06360 [Psychrobacter sp. CAM01]|uniref:hypothetical protein n=1 Tax=Psychrobacter sp. CAM01 TaxID=3080335 RepID=UPI00293560FE|nr:hypothetical protein [Psychrobacter sp. CAM01]MDV2860330.1 hypothetical protein [Psychrobacter sp. CAM01]
MLKFIKVRKKIINAADIESVQPGTYRDHNGLQQHRIVVTLQNGNRYNFSVDSSFEIQAAIDDIFEQIARLNS